MLIGLLVLLAIGCHSSPDRSIPSQLGGQTMHLESSAFTHNGMIPAEFTCDSSNLSPPLSWSQPPANTQSLALIVDDPDAPMGTFVHWVLFNLPRQTASLPEHITSPSALPDHSLEGRNDFGKLGYGGPCPPSGTHRYFFKLYALDTLLNVRSGATKAQVEAAMQGHILASAELIGLYQRSR
jgi:hypothetical protein